MKITLAQVMELDIMKPAIIKTAQEQLPYRQVEWVSITEAPVENFIRQNELVLTTGIGCNQEPKAFYAFVQDVIKSEASGLAVAIGRFVFELSEDVRTLAENEQFPILFLPWEIRFADITQAVTAKLVDSKQDDWQFTQKVQQELLSLMLAGNHLSALAEHVAGYAAVPIVITDAQGRIKGKSHGAEPVVGLVSKVYKHMRTSGQESEHHPLERKIQTLHTDGTDVHILPIIQANEQIQGYVFAVNRDKMDSSDLATAFILLEHAGTAAAFWFLQENTVQETEARMRNHFVADLAQGLIETEAQLKIRAEALGYEVSVPYIAIVGMLHNMEELYSRSDQVASFKDWQLSMVHYIEEEIYYAGVTVERETMSTFMDGQLLIYLAVPCEDYRTTVNGFLDLLDRRLAHLLPDVEITWGIGDQQLNTYAFEDRYQEAKQALLLGIGRKGQGSRIFYTDTRIDRVLYKIGQERELRSLVLDYAAPLFAYDEQRQMDLVGTFVAYQRNQNKVTQTARFLHLHRQSLLYRLRKIEALTHLSLANPDDVFLLDLSIRISMIQHHMQTPNS
ncbi:PucR family transcriptional regulator ligand-binding domain-containing protein [Shouchella clausii]|uniref:PucR family transcriptional regulator n=1 Tax=Shouchella TaxID=2893057 RepID=UPI0004E66772|nr:MULTISPECIES: PucR family transcriptional regulator [Shouchella]ALA52871.1 Purine catabolism regulatory protein [Shouchella clausii]MBU3233318.1 PucR family transcriptional regulator ligand-binding domain-containing protein [Shouchella clausii]MBU3266246.1 PucR family transcriptional regulator ligand-binding domain-containing protein [Shouchella clausii]MBU3509339.1 PucR family transcriptional regulator ligand-binding domain-containing protein [Shouchella clausii]MBU3535591.1 PucR family tr